MALKPPYQKTVWKNREVERPRTYNIQENEDGTITLIPAEGAIIEPGTPITAQVMQNIEDGIEALDNTLKSHLADYESLIKGGETHEAVLQNGWTGKLYYSKNDLGLVWLRGYIRPGELTENTIIATMPADYAPLSRSVPIPIFRSARPRRGVVGLSLNEVSNQIITLSEMAETFSEGQYIYINILYQSVGKEV